MCCAPPNYTRMCSLNTLGNCFFTTEKLFLYSRVRPSVRRKANKKKLINCVPCTRAQADGCAEKLKKLKTNKQLIICLLCTCAQADGCAEELGTHS